MGNTARRDRVAACGPRILSLFPAGVKVTKPAQKRSHAAAPITARDAVSVFPTELGWIGLVGARECVIALTFGHETPVGVRRDLDRKFALPEHLPEADWFPSLRNGLQSFAAGEPVNFSAVEIRFGKLTAFRRAVIAAVRNIGYGQTMAYGEVAQRSGFTGAARAVGQVMATNPIPLILPCHRVLRAGGHLGGYSARSGLAMKQRLLTMEQMTMEQTVSVPSAGATRLSAGLFDDMDSHRDKAIA